MTKFDARLAAFQKSAGQVSEGVGEALGDLSGLVLGAGAAYAVGSTAYDLGKNTVDAFTGHETEFDKMVRERRERNRKPGGSSSSSGDAELGKYPPGWGVGEAKP